MLRRLKCAMPFLSTLLAFCLLATAVPAFTGAASVPSGASPDTPPVASVLPTTPLTNVKVTPSSIAAGGSITVSWTQVVGSTRYRIRLYRQNPDKSWTNIVYNGSQYSDYGNVSSVTLKNLTWEGAYKILAYSGNNSGWYTPGTYSNVYEVTSPLPPSAPTNIKTSVKALTSGGSNTVSWAKVPGATKYRIRLFRQNTNGTWSNITYGGALYKDYGDVSSAIYTGLTWAGAYKFYIYAGNAFGWYEPGAYSNTYTVAPAVLALPTTPLTNVKVTPSSIAAGGSITVSWTQVVGSTRYRIRLYRQNPDKSWTNIVYSGSQYSDYGNVSSVTLKNLTWGGAYKILAYSGNNSGWYTPGTYSNVYYVTTSTLTDVKTSATSIASGGSITASWTKVTGATKYRIRLYRQNANGTWTNISFGGSTYTDYGNVSYATLSGLTWAGTYKILVYSGNGSGWVVPGTYTNTYTVVSKTYVDVDISEQTLRYYVNGQVVLSSPVVTGRPSMPTVQGTFAIYAKTRNTYLDGPGYHTFVSYWMPFYGGYGLHDATWQAAFGGQRYLQGYGSHGCVNMPLDKARTLYGMVSVGTVVKVHQ